MRQDVDFGGNGTESGTVMVTGAFTGTVVSHIQIRDSARAPGGYFSVACSEDPIAQEMCAPRNPSTPSADSRCSKNFQFAK